MRCQGGDQYIWQERLGKSCNSYLEHICLRNERSFLKINFLLFFSTFLEKAKFKTVSN